MVYRIADNILTPLGATTEENYEALKSGRSALSPYVSYSGRKENDYIASRFDDEQKQKLMVKGLTWFESLIYHSVKKALSGCDNDLASSRTLFVVSTTKANIDQLSSPDYEKKQPAESAKRIADLLGISTQPLVVCNACISGVAAIITAQRMLNAGSYDTAIVAGCDVISHFVVSGFQSLKAMSPEPCRPFDIERLGLNLGEAAATLILGCQSKTDNDWQIVNGALRNDAYHISSPSPKGEGCASAIQYVTKGIDLQTLSAVNVHGTATMYNDQMESKAIAASGLSEIPINTLKGYLGHTLGASGILETIITMHSVEHGELLGTRGFSEIGVSGHVNISAQPMTISKQSFVKVISGFGGCNAAVYCALNSPKQSQQYTANTFTVEHHVRITPPSDLTEIYKQHIGNYPKFYKMDRLCQLGFIASELLLQQESPRKEQCADRAVVLFNHSSSVWVDREYERSIEVGEEYFPSPSLFVYTLPNIVCGEIALRNGYHSETSFYILNTKDEEMMNNVLASTFNDQSLQSIIAGWLDYKDEGNFEADFKLIRKI